MEWRGEERTGAEEEGGRKKEKTEKKEKKEKEKEEEEGERQPSTVDCILVTYAAADVNRDEGAGGCDAADK